MKINTLNGSIYEHVPENDIIDAYFGPDYIGTCIDIGASDGFAGNNTLLYELRGWDVLCIEPNPVYYNQMKTGRVFQSMLTTPRKNICNYAVGETNENDIEFYVFDVGGGNLSAVSGLSPDDRLIDSHKHLISNEYTIQVKLRTLDTIIQEHFSHITQIDFVSIDTEGTELQVLKGFDIEKWKPPVFIIENNFEESHLIDYLTNFGYIKHHRHHMNDFYVREDLL